MGACIHAIIYAHNFHFPTCWKVYMANNSHEGFLTKFLRQLDKSTKKTIFAPRRRFLFCMQKEFCASSVNKGVVWKI